MKQETARRFWKKLLQTMAGTGLDPQQIMENEAVQWNLNTKMGFYDDMPDEEFESMKADMKELSALYSNRSTMPADALLIRAIRSTHLEPMEVERLARILERASMRRDYTTSFDRLDAEPGEQFHSIGTCTPQEIYGQLSRDVYGQDAAKRAISMLAWHHLNGRPGSLLMAGPSGSGKTALIEALGKVPGIKVRTLDCSRLAPDGYSGSVHLCDVFPEEDEDSAFVLFLDEFDKASTEKHIGSNGTNYTQMIMNQLLLLLEHRPLTFAHDGKPGRAYTVETKNISIIMGGAFETLLKKKDSKTGGIGFNAEMKKVHDYINTSLTRETFIEAGIRHEIMGRITDLVTLEQMTADDFLRIINTTGISPVDRIAAEYKIRLTVDENLKAELAEKAAASGLGCRAIYSELKQKLNALMFNDPTKAEYHISTEETLAYSFNDHFC